MTVQQIVDPSRIEAELIKLWEDLAKQNKIRGSLFNLIVYNKLSSRTDYIRKIVQKVVENFPCRTLFISLDSDQTTSYLKTAISVVMPASGESSTACDQIDIGFSLSEIHKVPFLVLPHILPDLPTYLLWTEDPNEPNVLFEPLCKLASRLIFDSESSDNLLAFANKLLTIRQQTNLDIADLNWARIEGWRELITSTFNPKERLNLLHQLSFVKITYNSKETPFFCHLKIQAMYFLAWLSKRLGWHFQKASQDLVFMFQKSQANIFAESWENLGPGAIISIELKNKEGYHIEATRSQIEHHHVRILFSSPAQCDLPCQFIFEKSAAGQSLVKEICTKGTSMHYLEMLQELILLDKDKLC